MINILDIISSKVFPKPLAASSNEWREWENEARGRHPILYKLLEDLPFYISCKWQWLITNPIYNVKCKYFKKYHHIKIDVTRFYEPYGKKSLRKYHWTDSDSLILDGMFQLLVDFIEKESDTIDWSGSPETQKAYDEMQELYVWWTETRLNIDDACPSWEDYGVNDIFDDDAHKLPGYQSWRNACAEWDDRERERDVEETEMLIRLITIRKFLWS